LKARLTALAQQSPRFGSPRLCVLVRREQIHNHKRVERIYREAGLSLRRKRRKRLSRQRAPVVAVHAANEEWALDFVTDALASTRHTRILTVVDVFTRECLALETDTSMGGLRVLRVLDRLIAERGAPEHAWILEADSWNERSQGPSTITRLIGRETVVHPSLSRQFVEPSLLRLAWSHGDILLWID